MAGSPGFNLADPISYVLEGGIGKGREGKAERDREGMEGD
jgi:hypothetical protein